MDSSRDNQCQLSHYFRSAQAGWQPLRLHASLRSGQSPRNPPIGRNFLDHIGMGVRMRKASPLSGLRRVRALFGRKKSAEVGAPRYFRRASSSFSIDRAIKKSCNVWMPSQAKNSGQPNTPPRTRMISDLTTDLAPRRALRGIKSIQWELRERLVARI